MADPLFVKYLPLLQAITSIKDQKLQKRLIRLLCRNVQFKTCICEIAHNLVRRNIPLTEVDKKRLNRHSSKIRGLLKKKGFSQSGGFLNIAVPLLAAKLGHMIYSQIRKE